MNEYAQLTISHSGIRVVVYPSFYPNGDIQFCAEAVEVTSDGQRISSDVLAHTVGHSSQEKARLQVKRLLTARARRILEFVDADEKSLTSVKEETQPE